MNSFFYTFLAIMIALIYQAFIGLTKDVTISMSKYALRGGSVTIKCAAHYRVGNWGIIELEYRLDSVKDQKIIRFFKKNRSVKAFPDDLFKNRIKYSHNGVRNANITLTRLTCDDSRDYHCTIFKENKLDNWDYSKLNVLDNTGEITLNVKGQGKECPGTESQCRACNNLKDIQGYAKVDEELKVECTKKMPFPYKMGNVNTFKWYYLQPTGNGNFQETEETRTFNKKPTFSKDTSTTPPSVPTLLENCQRVENKTSYLIYVPTQNNDQVITLKCRIELKVESVKDSKEKTINICLLGDWSQWKPSSKCTKSCTRSMRRECGVGECQGESEKTESCTGDLCNTDKWSDWIPWSKCAKTCTRSRRRECLARECSDESKKQESCTGDLCIKNVELDKAKASSSVVPIVVGVVAAIVVAVSAVALWMKFRKKGTNEQTSAKPQPLVTDTTTQYASDYYSDYNDPSKVPTKEEETAPSKDPGSQKQPKSVKEDLKDEKKKKKTKNVNENGDRFATKLNINQSFYLKYKYHCIISYLLLYIPTFGHKNCCDVVILIT